MPSFTGGEKLQRRLAEMAAKLDRPATVRVGFLEGATYPDGTPVAMVASIQEFGAPSVNIPPRPFFRGMIAAKRDEWGPAVALQLKKANYDAAVALGRVGEGIKGQLQQAIVDFSGVPLAPATIAAKGFDKQLVDTSHLLNSVDYEVN